MLNVGREDESKEFKKSTVELEKGLVSLTAMLNKHCKGEVLFGVKVNGVRFSTLDAICEALDCQPGDIL
jgi:hypothetical protein